MPTESIIQPLLDHLLIDLWKCYRGDMFQHIYIVYKLTSLQAILTQVWPFQHSIFGDFSIFFLLLKSYLNLIVNHALQSKLMYSKFIHAWCVWFNIFLWASVDLSSSRIFFHLKRIVKPSVFLGRRSQSTSLAFTLAFTHIRGDFFHWYPPEKF